MLEKVNLQKVMLKEEYKPEIKKLRAQLAVLQQQVREARLPVIVLFEGWSAAGKGSLIAQVIKPLDPRNFKVYSYVAANEEERRKPLPWRYWRDIPARGRMAVLDRSWYQDISVAQLEQELPGQELERRTQSIRTFERQLTDDGYQLVKFFLHISQKEQKQRLDALEKSRNTAWRVTRQDRQRNRRYEDYFAVYEDMLANTHTTNAPWHVVSAHDKRSATVEVLQTLVEAIQQALKRQQELLEKKEDPAAPVRIPPEFHLVKVPRLSEINMQKSLTQEEYEQALQEKQGKLRALHNKLYRKKVPVVVVYEGWDAAGKGGNIKRVSAALDPRGYEVIPIASPSQEELARHYLWRFWTRMPKDGHVAVFDRSWYGRVMVERIEGFCTVADWKRAYAEINEFERELYDWGAILVKFWLNVDADEQLRRFQERQNTPEKRWKITDEDWRNREKWSEYEVAVDDMLRYTSTDFAPWNVIESNDKKFARVKALALLISAIEDRL